VQRHGDFGDDIGSCLRAAVLVGYGISRESMTSDFFEVGMACSENRWMLEVSWSVVFNERKPNHVVPTFPGRTPICLCMIVSTTGPWYGRICRAELAAKYISELQRRSVSSSPAHGS
jgi:hypothetical protein